MSELQEHIAMPRIGPPGWTPDDVSIELSSRRTGMSFQRTRMSADRTLMSIIRTALSLIGFGFTIFQFFRYLRDNVGATEVVPARAAFNFGVILVFLGVGFLTLGIATHVTFMGGLRHERDRMMAERLIHGQSAYPPSLTLLAAILLLVVGLIAIVGMVTRAGPLH
jgi:putative membrane protein